MREEATGNLCLGTMSRLQERVRNFLAGLVGRKEGVNGAAVSSCNQGLKCCCDTPGPIANPSQMHIPPWLLFGNTC